jgi:hypothetical protein
VRSLKNSEQINVRQMKSKKRRDFVFTIYKNGTLLIQTRKKDDCLVHIKKIIGNDDDIIITEIVNKNEKEEEKGVKVDEKKEFKDLKRKEENDDLSKDKDQNTKYI